MHRQPAGTVLDSFIAVPIFNFSGQEHAAEPNSEDDDELLTSYLTKYELLIMRVSCDTIIHMLAKIFNRYPS